MADRARGLLNGTVLPFDPEEFRELEQRAIAHSATWQNPAELPHVQVPTQVIGAPENPINPPPHAAYLAATLGTARLTTLAGMGHALDSAIIQQLANTIPDFTGQMDESPRMVWKP